MKEKIIRNLKKVAQNCGLTDTEIKLDYPENPDYGDFSSNIALIGAKKLGLKPRELAERIKNEIEDVFKKENDDFIEKVEVAGSGFLNFFVNNKVIAEEIVNISKNGSEYGRSIFRKDENILVEYTDPNAFKVFHIGHLMSNAIGESISRLIEYSGASVKRICYPSDIGLHIAKAIWAIKQNAGDLPADTATIQQKTDFLGKMYVIGTKAYETEEKIKKEIDVLNKIIYEKSDKEVNELYEKGRKWSLDHFELIYKTLDTKFDDCIYESEMASIGLATAEESFEKGVLERSEGAIVFKGEKYGLHTRVFVSSNGIPTYEAKDLGLNITKFKKFPDTNRSIIVTASEQNDYFKVLLKVFSLIDEKNGQKTTHIGHGMMRFLAGKMSSRTGNVVTAESLLEDIKNLAKEKIAGRKFTKKEVEEISEMIAVAAIKYTILRSSIGGDIAFDSTASISFEGDSGPYLQYSAVRANSILEKAKDEKITITNPIELPEKISRLESLVLRFPDMVMRATYENGPQIIANYLIGLAGTFNSFYASQVIVDKKNKLSPYYVILTKAFLIAMTNGLWLLGIKVPEKM